VPVSACSLAVFGRNGRISTPAFKTSSSSYYNYNYNYNTNLYSAALQCCPVARNNVTYSKNTKTVGYNENSTTVTTK